MSLENGLPWRPPAVCSGRHQMKRRLLHPRHQLCTAADLSSAAAGLYAYRLLSGHPLKPASHDADTDTDILADILARIVARKSACRSVCHRNNFRKSPVSDVSAKILARMSGVGVVECRLNGAAVELGTAAPRALNDGIVALRHTCTETAAQPCPVRLGGQPRPAAVRCTLHCANDC